MVWFGTLTVAAVAVLLLFPTAAQVPAAGGSARPGADVAVGALLAVLAVVALWRARRRGRVRPLVQHLDRLTPRRTAAVAAVLALNPKNVALVLGGAVAVPVPGPSVAESLLVGAGFGLIASAPLLLALSVSTTPSPRVEHALDRTHAWATRHGDLLAAAVLAVLAAILIARGIAA